MEEAKNSILSRKYPSMKIIIVGDSHVGKSSLLCRYSTEEFSTKIQPTIGVEHRQKEVTIDNTQLRLNIWDTTGQEKYRAVTATFFKGSNGCVVTFDVTSRDSFKGVQRWLEEIHQHAPEQTITILVGNKIDLPNRQVTTAEASEYAKKKGMEYFEASAFTGKNVNQLFNRLVEKVWEKNSDSYKKFGHNEKKRLASLQNNPSPLKSRSCCN